MKLILNIPIVPTVLRERPPADSREFPGVDGAVAQSWHTDCTINRVWPSGSGQNGAYFRFSRYLKMNRIIATEGLGEKMARRRNSEITDCRKCKKAIPAIATTCVFCGARLEPSSISINGIVRASSGPKMRPSSLVVPPPSRVAEGLRAAPPPIPGAAARKNQPTPPPIPRSYLEQPGREVIPPPPPSESMDDKTTVSDVVSIIKKTARESAYLVKYYAIKCVDAVRIKPNWEGALEE